MGQLTSNALAWAVFRCGGGFQRSLGYVAVYAALVFGAMVLATASSFNGYRDVMEGTPRPLLIMQFVIMGLAVGFSLVTTIQKDVTSQIIESHRLMPVNPRLAVLGYVAGSAAPFGLIALFNFIVGGIAAGIAGLPIGWWVAANVVILSFCAFLWTLLAGAAFYGNAVALFCIVPFVLVLISGGEAGYILPSVRMLVSPVVGSSAVSTSVLGSEQLQLWFVSLLLQAGVAWVFVEMGARRYRSADFPPLSASWGLFLLALLAASAIISIHTYPRATFLNQEFMVVAASISLVMVATIIIVSALASDSIEKMALSVRVFDRTTVLLVCAIPLIVGAFGACSPDTEDKTLRCFLTVGSFFIWSLLVAAWTKRLLLHNWRMTGIFTAALAIMLTPMMGALLLHSEISTAGAVIMQISPLAMVAAIWSDDDFGARLLPLAIQAALAALGMFLLHRRIRALRPPMIKPVA